VLRSRGQETSRRVDVGWGGLVNEDNGIMCDISL